MATSKIQRFTEQGRRVLVLAQAAATRMQHNQIDTGHILVALLDDGTGVATHILHGLGVDFQRVSELVENMTPEALKQPVDHLDLSPDTKMLLQLAIAEAHRLDQFNIGTEHLLLGLVRLNSSVGLDVLTRLGITPDVVQQRTYDILDKYPTQPSPRRQPVDAPQQKEVSQVEGDRVVVQKMERFTQRARRVLSLAQEEAERLQHSSIGTEHLLLGLMREEGGIAGRVLRDLGLDQRRVEELVERMTRAGQRSTSSKLDLSPGTKKVLELAVDEARRMGHHYIGTEHLLLGLVRQSEGIAIDVLKRLNVSPEEVRRQTRRVLQENPVQPPGQPAAALHIQQPTPPEPSAHYAGHILGQARKEARILGHQFVGIWHLLLALLGSDDVAEQILRELGLDEQRIESMMNALPDRATDDKELAVTVRAEAILRYASTAAASLGSTYVGSEHILRAFLYNDEEIFKLLKISPDDVRRLLQEHEKRLIQLEQDISATAKSAEHKPEPVRFGMTAWEAVGLAIDAAISLGSRSVGVWHLLLALIQNDGFAGRLLRELGVHPQRIEDKIRATDVPQQLMTVHRQTTTGLELSADIREILQLAVEEAKAERKTTAHSEYLLLAILHEHRDVFVALGLDPETIHAKIEQLTQGPRIIHSDMVVAIPVSDTQSQQITLSTSPEGNYMDEKDIYRALAEAEKAGQPVALATVVRTVGSMPRHAGSKLLIYADGRTVGTVGGGAMEARVVEEAKAAIKDGKPHINTYTLNDLKAGDPGVCGGTADIFIDPLFVQPTLVVIGCGHVGKALAELAKWAGFRVIVSDDRGELCNPQHIPNMDGYIVTPPNAAHQHIDLGPNTYVAALTRGLPIDLDLFPPLLQANVPYLGLIGSRRRWALTIKELEARGFTKEQLARVRAPIGLELEAETPKEIAVSILAEIIMLRNGGTGQPMQWMGSAESAAE